MDEIWLASGTGNDQTVKLWDTGEGSVVQTLETDGGGVSSIVFSGNDDGLLVSGLGDAMIRLWEVNGMQ
jgi:WD40 repeat protein